MDYNHSNIRWLIILIILIFIIIMGLYPGGHSQRRMASSSRTTSLPTSRSMTTFPGVAGKSWENRGTHGEF